MSSVLSHSQTPSTTSFTCNSCSIRFPTADLQRLHMKTDWHRYNLKRRVAELPLISADVFAEKFAMAQVAEDNEDEYGFKVYSKQRSASERQLTKKELRKQQRLLSRGRNNLVIGLDDGVDLTRDLSPISVAASEFSNFSLAESLALTYTTDTDYETHSEGFDYTSDDDLSTSQDGEVSPEESDLEETRAPEIDESIPITTCFYCGLQNLDIEINMEHMFKKHGLYIPDKEYLTNPEGLLEFLSEIIAIGHECLVCGFFGRNLESVRLHMRSKSHCTLPYESKDDRELLSRFYDFGSMSEGESDDEPEIAEVDETGTELMLPNGARLGHRSMARYYRQNIALDLVPSDGQQTLKAVDRRLQSGLTLKEVNKIEKRTQLEEQRTKSHQERRTLRGNLNFQKHFRDEMLQ